MIWTLIIIQIGVIGFNVCNSVYDAVRIRGNKTINHAINLGAYLIYCTLAWLPLMRTYKWEDLTLFAVMIFACRQITFDIPLNWRRGLKWDYVSPANPPVAIMDRIEQWIFGRNGRLPVYIYSGVWVLSLTALLWVFSR